MQEGQYKELQQKEQSLKQQMRELQASIGENQGQMSEKIRRHENLSGANEQRLLQLEEMLQGYVPNEEISQEVQEQLKKRSGSVLKEPEKRRTCGSFGRGAGEGGDTAHCQKPLHFCLSVQSV